MKRILGLLVVFAVVVAGCNSSVEEKYEQGRADQKAKADKMIENEASPE